MNNNKRYTLERIDDGHRIEVSQSVIDWLELHNTLHINEEIYYEQGEETIYKLIKNEK